MVLWTLSGGEMNRRGFLSGLAKATATVAFFGVTRLSIADIPGNLSEDNLEPIWVEMSKQVDDVGLRVLARSHAKSDLCRQMIECGVIK